MKIKYKIELHTNNDKKKKIGNKAPIGVWLISKINLYNTILRIAKSYVLEFRGI